MSKKTRAQKIKSSMREIAKIETVAPKLTGVSQGELVVESLYDVDPAFLKKDLLQTILATSTIIAVLMVLVAYFK